MGIKSLGLCSIWEKKIVEHMPIQCPVVKQLWSLIEDWIIE